MVDDRQLREMTCDPKFRKVLVTDGKTGVGQAVVRALIAAGADLVWVGYAEPWKNLRRTLGARGTAAGDDVAARPDGLTVGEDHGRRKSAARSTSSSIRPSCIEPMASPHAAA